MRQICPNCQKPIDVPDAAAGGAYDCPACGESFPVPQAYTPAVTVPPAPPAAADRPAPPPGFVPPGERAAGPRADAAPPASAGDLRSRGLTLTPGVLSWVPVACLALCLVLTFFAWVGAFPGGYRVFSQNPWEAGVGSVDAPATAVPEEVQKAEPELRRLAPPNLLLLLYGVLLVVTLILAALELGFGSQADATNVPGGLAWLPGVLQYRFALLIGLTGLLLFLVVFQAWRGFGLETAVHRYAAGQFSAELERADTATKEQIAKIKVGQEAARFAVRPTFVRDLAAAAHVVTLLAVLGRFWLARRGPKPPPRLAVQY